jgi:hypothetical protein
MRENQEMKDLDNEEEEDASLDDEEDDESAVASGFGDDDEEGDDSSLEQLLAQRSAARRASEPEENEDLMALASEREPPLRGEALNPRLIPVKDRQEFVCKRCFLVKARSQLADAERVLCRDCV